MVRSLEFCVQGVGILPERIVSLRWRLGRLK